MKLFLAALLLQQFSQDIAASRFAVAVIEAGRVVWQKGKISEAACEAPVLAERISLSMLDLPAPTPAGATIRQVLENKADGAPGEEVLENAAFVKALEPLVKRTRLPNAVQFAAQKHAFLGWFEPKYASERVFWCHSESVLLVRIPAKNLALVIATPTGDLDDLNVTRSTTVLAFLKDVAGLPVAETDELIARALDALRAGDRSAASALVRRALDQSPELETAPDVSLLHLFSQLGMPETEASATAVIQAHPSLPTAWFYYGRYLQNNKRYREAAACYEKITLHQPPWHHAVVAAAREELTHLKTY